MNKQHVEFEKCRKSEVNISIKYYMNIIAKSGKFCVMPSKVNRVTLIWCSIHKDKASVDIFQSLGKSKVHQFVAKSGHAHN